MDVPSGQSCDEFPKGVRPYPAQSSSRTSAKFRKAADWPSQMNTIVPLPFPSFCRNVLAILQLRDAQRDGLGAFARALLDLLQFLPQLPRVSDLRGDRLGDVFESPLRTNLPHCKAVV